MPIPATWTDLEIVILSEVKSERQKDKYRITYMWKEKKNGTNELTKQK